MSPGAARRFVRAILSGAGHQDWCESAELAVSEIVTNAVLHAHTDCVVSVRLSPRQAQIEVKDFSLVLPVQRRYTAQATTGRGLGLVSHLAADHGVDPCEDGKVVWFVLDATCASAADQESSDEWDLSDLLDTPIPALEPQAELVDVPVALWMAALQHQDAVLRELHLHLAGDEALTAAAQLDLAAASRALNRLVRASETARGRATANLTVEPGPPAEFSALQDVLDYGWQLAAAGESLARPALPEVVALRDWACEQVIAQHAGVPPSPWSASEQRRVVDDRVAAGLSGLSRALEPNNPPVPQWDDHDVRTSTASVVAADDSNRIIAVSPVAAALLGWEAEDLIGRRIATIIPPELRELHVAGFTRHLTTGEQHVLGIPVTLPVLRADGERLICELLILSTVGTDGRSVYVAELVPLP